MKVVLLFFIFGIEIFAEYEKGEIDTHGGKESKSFYTKQNDFKNATFGVSMFLDKNITKKREPTKK